MRMFKSGAFLFSMIFVTQASAQHTTCTGSGSMVHCNTIGAQGMTSTDCMVAGNMATCNTIGNSPVAESNYPDGGVSLAQGIVALINSGKEKKFRKKLGSMMADGNCSGAADFAYREGRLDVGNAIASRCRTTPAAGSSLNLLPVDETLAHMIAKGDCRGAVQQAYRLGKVTVGDNISKTCPKP